MNVEHLRLFTRIAALGNISQAGLELGLSPAVSSSHMNKLEDSLGTRLLHRTTRKVSLTEDGVAFLPHAADILENIEVAKAAVGGANVVPKGRLRITAPASFGRMHLIPVIDDFLSEYPDLDVDLHLSDTIVNLVEGGFDVAIRDAKMTDSSMIARKLAPDNRVLCAAPRYLKELGTPKKPEDLLNHRCVNLMGLEAWTFKTLKGNKTVKTKNRFRTDNGEAARDAATQGLGITMLSTWCCYKQLKSKELVQVLKKYPIVNEVALWAVYPSSRLLAPKVRVFIDHLAGHFSGTPYWDKK
ncbi:MAG: LysR family transcriptional regulator [Bdellovibrionales bacterium]|nr:LysR family transcriptional regulator [Bdellovibrionales bacterium]